VLAHVREHVRAHACVFVHSMQQQKSTKQSTNRFRSWLTASLQLERQIGAFKINVFLDVHAHSSKGPLQELVVEEPEGDLTHDDTAQQVLLHPLLHLGTGHVTGQRVLLRLRLRLPLLLVIALIKQLHLFIHSRRALACVVLLG